jgi:hypothetical protein
MIAGPESAAFEMAAAAALRLTGLGWIVIDIVQVVSFAVLTQALPSSCRPSHCSFRHCVAIWSTPSL